MYLMTCVDYVNTKLNCLNYEKVVFVRFVAVVCMQLGIQIVARWYWSNKWGELNFEFGGGNIFRTTLGLSMQLK